MAQILAQFTNIDGSTVVTVFDDITYEVQRTDYIQRFDMNKWYRSGTNLVKHVTNDVRNGTWGELYEVVLEAN